MMECLLCGAITGHLPGCGFANTLVIPSPAPAVVEAEQWIKQMEDNERPNVLLVKWATVLADEVGPRLFPSVRFCVDDLLRAAARIEQLEAGLREISECTTGAGIPEVEYIWKIARALLTGKE